MLTIAMYYLARRKGIQKHLASTAEEIDSGGKSLSDMARTNMVKTLTGIAKRVSTFGKEVV